MTMSALLDAPEELLDAITTYLPHTDIFSLARTCKALWHSTGPRIFRTISMTWDANKVRPSAPRITSLLRSLVKSPRNAARIEHVELQACNYEPYEGREHEAGGRPANCHAYRLQASDKPVFERNLTRMGLREVDRWLSSTFEANDLRALMAVLLMRCTRLKSLNMASELFLTVASDSDTWLPSMLDHCLSAPISSDRGLSRFDRFVVFIPLRQVLRPKPAFRASCGHSNVRFVDCVVNQVIGRRLQAAIELAIARLARTSPRRNSRLRTRIVSLRYRDQVRWGMGVVIVIDRHVQDRWYGAEVGIPESQESWQEHSGDLTAPVP